MTYPSAYLEITDWWGLSVGHAYYLDAFHQPILVANGAYTAGDTLNIKVQYEFIGSPGNQFTLKVYSKGSNNILNNKGNTYMVHMNGE